MNGHIESTSGGEDEAPWVFIASKKSKRGRSRHLTNAINFHAPPLELPSVGKEAPTSNAASVSQIREDHKRTSTRWRELPSSGRLEALVTLLVSDHASVSKALCLGAGSFGGPLDGGEAFRRAHIQTAAFLRIVELLESRSGNSIHCIFQEPLYSAADKEYLLGLGHSVVDTPAATTMIDASTLVFAIHFPLREYLACLDGEKPAVLIGTGYNTFEALPQFTADDVSGRLGPFKALHDEYDCHAFPREKHDFCFSDTVIYWRPTRSMTVHD